MSKHKKRLTAESSFNFVMIRNEVCSPIGGSRGFSNFRIKTFFRTIFHYCASLVISCFIYVIKSKMFTRSAPSAKGHLHCARYLFNFVQFSYNSLASKLRNNLSTLCQTQHEINTKLVSVLLTDFYIFLFFPHCFSFLSAKVVQ